MTVDFPDCPAGCRDGIVDPPISGNDPHGAYANGPCPDCDGLGVLIPDEMVRVVKLGAMFADDAMGSIGAPLIPLTERNDRKVRAGLAALVRWQQENRWVPGDRPGSKNPIARPETWRPE